MCALLSRFISSLGRFEKLAATPRSGRSYDGIDWAPQHIGHVVRHYHIHSP